MSRSPKPCLAVAAAAFLLFLAALPAGAAETHRPSPSLPLTLAGGMDPETADYRVSLGFDWMFGMRIGLEQLLDGRLSGRGAIGMSVMGLLSSELLAVFRITGPDAKFRLDLLAGVPTAAMPLSFDAAMMSLGGALRIGLRVNDGLTLDLRVGAGLPLFFESGTDVIRDIDMKVWPDFVFCLTFGL